MSLKYTSGQYLSHLLMQCSKWWGKVKHRATQVTPCKQTHILQSSKSEVKLTVHYAIGTAGEKQHHLKKKKKAVSVSTS